MERRTIKFRGKDIKTGEWVYGYYSVFTYESQGGDYPRDDTGHFIMPIKGDNDQREEDEYVRVIPESVGQFTGSLDRADKEVYEGHRIGFMYWSVYEQRSFPEYVDFRETELKAGSGVVYWDESNLQWFVKMDKPYTTYHGDVSTPSIMDDMPLIYTGIGKEALEDYNKDFDEEDKTSDTVLGFEIIGSIHDQPVEIK